MSFSKHIVLFGAGKSASILIDYLKAISIEKNWQVTIADSNYEAVVEKVGSHSNAFAVQVDIANEKERKALVSQADVVISMMPHSLHYLLALDCIEFGKHLLTASYVDSTIKELNEQIREKKLLFLCEMGLDPGIDHMSAVQLFHRIKKEGGKVTSFRSHCGGLVAPESDDNPWHYKISWNPRNIILAGKSGAVYKENNKEIHLAYEELFDAERVVEVAGHGIFSYYPNRDSLGYILLYELEDAATFVRTTLRHPEFSFGWKNVVDLKLTDEEKVYNTEGMTVAEFFKQHFDKHGFNEWLNEMLTSRLSYAKQMMEKLTLLMEAEVEEAGDNFMAIDEKGELTSIETGDVKDKAVETVAIKMHEANTGMKQLFYLGINDETPINKGLCSAADILQFVLEQKLALHPHDKDMIVMLHEIEYEINGATKQIKSSLVVKGEDSVHTAMAKTVGLPLGIAAKLILEEKIKETGVHIPVIPGIYEPVLEELKQYGISFTEY